MFQIAATQVFNAANIPDTDAFRKLVNPYGDAKVANLIPGSFQKLWSAVMDNPDELSTIYGNTYADLFAYLSTTGEYDLNNSEDKSRLHEDAKVKARGLTMIRAASQFIGPTAARPDYRYKSELGEYFWVNEMVKQYDAWKKEDFETATGKFLETFGEGALIYLGAKTSLDPKFKGVEVSSAYGRWEGENKDLINTFKSTAPYLAPLGDQELSMGVWSRQLDARTRNRNQPIDRLAQAQLRAGSYVYRTYKKNNPNASSEDKKAERERIHKMYNGFPVDATFEANANKEFIAKMTELVSDSRTAENPVADSIREYLKNRQKVVDRLKLRAGVSLQAEKNPLAVDYRNQLLKRGEELATLNPDFRRVWEQEFQAELE